MALTDTQPLALEELGIRKLRRAYPEMPAAIEVVARSLMIQLRETPATEATRR